jgi:hypothetical protein
LAKPLAGFDSVQKVQRRRQALIRDYIVRHRLRGRNHWIEIAAGKLERAAFCAFTESKQ